MRARHHPGRDHLDIVATLPPRTVVAPRPPSRRRRPGSAWPGRLAVLAAVVGAAVRVEQFAWRRSLWLDEALVANNIVGRSFGGLLHPLTGQQAAPIGWLWIERAAVILFGDNEYALRLVPLAAGLVALPLVYRLARAVAGPWAGAAAATLVALSPAAVRYSVEVKQYSTDLAVSLVVLVLAARAVAQPLGRPARSGPAILGWAGAGALLLWVSHPAVLVLAGTAVALWVSSLGRRAWVVAAASVLWTASFGVEWFVSLRRVRTNRYLHAYWRAGLAPEPFRWSGLWSWLGHLPGRLLADPLAMSAVTGLGAIAGLAWAARRRPVHVALLVLPVVAGLGAACLGLFPLQGRMAMWLLPAAVVGVGAAVTAVADLVDRSVFPTMARAAHRDRTRSRPWAAVAVAACCFALAVQGPGRRIEAVAHDPATWIDLRPLLQAIRGRVAPGDQVWVHSDDAPAAAYYALSTGVRTTAVLWTARRGGSCPGDPVAGRGRVWVVFGYQAASGVVDAPAAVDARLAPVARLLGRVRRPGVTATLWDFDAPPSGSVGPPGGALGCMAVERAPEPVPTGLASGPFGSGRRL